MDNLFNFFNNKNKVYSRAITQKKWRNIWNYCHYFTTHVIEELLQSVMFFGDFALEPVYFIFHKLFKRLAQHQTDDEKSDDVDYFNHWVNGRAGSVFVRIANSVAGNSRRMSR